MLKKMSYKWWNADSVIINKGGMGDLFGIEATMLMTIPYLTWVESGKRYIYDC
jgi:hypothetical protein